MQVWGFTMVIVLLILGIKFLGEDVWEMQQFHQWIDKAGEYECALE